MKIYLPIRNIPAPKVEGITGVTGDCPIITDLSEKTRIDGLVILPKMARWFKIYK